ncbi:hypothetical protein, variant 1 [Puccinia striiformis f. sp. tritici PST-78]|uniref:Secreted protein n=1 Tax=Puccinia striiformis f. sp. tritici PST-78 TaxID=1165861 RepID=A0A0L0V265_9BASI|nr:hypothetical protein, variant 1 [Puccinia striiformis f. sp. tritici PST-78]
MKRAIKLILFLGALAALGPSKIFCEELPEAYKVAVHRLSLPNKIDCDKPTELHHTKGFQYKAEPQDDPVFSFSSTISIQNDELWAEFPLGYDLAVVRQGKNLISTNPAQKAAGKKHHIATLGKPIGESAQVDVRYIISIASLEKALKKQESHAASDLSSSDPASGGKNLIKSAKTPIPIKLDDKAFYRKKFRKDRRPSRSSGPLDINAKSSSFRQGNVQRGNNIAATLPRPDSSMKQRILREGGSGSQSAKDPLSLAEFTKPPSDLPVHDVPKAENTSKSTSGLSKISTQLLNEAGAGADRDMISSKFPKRKSNISLSSHTLQLLQRLKENLPFKPQRFNTMGKKERVSEANVSEHGKLESQQDQGPILHAVPENLDAERSTLWLGSKNTKLEIGKGCEKDRDSNLDESEFITIELKDPLVPNLPTMPERQDSNGKPRPLDGKKMEVFLNKGIKQDLGHGTEVNEHSLTNQKLSANSKSVAGLDPKSIIQHQDFHPENPSQHPQTAQPDSPSKELTKIEASGPIDTKKIKDEYERTINQIHDSHNAPIAHDKSQMTSPKSILSKALEIYKQMDTGDDQEAIRILIEDYGFLTYHNRASLFLNIKDPEVRFKWLKQEANSKKMELDSKRIVKGKGVLDSV